MREENRVDEHIIPSDSIGGKEMSLKELFTSIKDLIVYFLSRWFIILIFSFLGAIIGLTYSFIKKTKYIASTTFVLEDDRGNSLGSLAGLASVAGVDLGGANGGSIFQGDNILDLYKSRNMIVKTLLTEVEFNNHKQLLVDRYIEFNKLRELWKDKKILKEITFDSKLIGKPLYKRLQDSLLTNFTSDINKNILSVTKPDKKTGIIRAEVSSKDEFFSKSFNENIVKNVNDFYIQTKTKKSIYNIKILQQKTDSVRTIMNGAIYSAVAVNDATPNLNPTRQIQRVAPAQKAQFSAETNKAILGALVQNLEMAKISLRKETPLIQIIDGPIYPLEKVKTGKAIAILIGGFIGMFLTLLVLTIINFFKQLS
jgi:hypothetical protein